MQIDKGWIGYNIIGDMIDALFKIAQTNAVYIADGQHLFGCWAKNRYGQK
jgi:hypothetical protein